MPLSWAGTVLLTLCYQCRPYPLQIINMAFKKLLISFFLCCLFTNNISAQLVINEGSNRNYAAIADENGDYPDWIEIYNTTADSLSLFGYSLSDNESEPSKWTFPNVKLPPNEFKTVFCSGKDRKPISGFTTVVNTGTYNPTIGWNTHPFDTPFYWDGVSNVLVSTCSYSSAGYTSNSVFKQSVTPFLSSVFSFQDGGEGACYANYGTPVALRPNMKLNGFTIGTGNVQNSPTDYPAPYGNWYWGAKNQMLILASELSNAGLTAGNISDLAFRVANTDPNTFYDYIEISLKLVSANELNSTFEAVDPNNNLHTNFKISRSGERVYLYSPTQQLLSSLLVSCQDLDNSIGSFPDSSSNIVLFDVATPAATNNLSTPYLSYLSPPTFSMPAGIYNQPLTVSISNPNSIPSYVYYTTNGDDPTTNSTLYEGEVIPVFYSSVLKARAFADTVLSSPNAVASYLLGVSHTTPILSVVTDNDNLYGANGIFDNWGFDWQRAAYIEYFDTTQQLLFSQKAGMQIDGGWGGSRSNPQHSFRVELDNGVLGDGSIEYPIIPNRPNRTKYSNFYLRNGSNQYLVLPYKDAAQVEMMCAETNAYYSAWRPITVYINGAYFGLYELREKFDTEYFKSIENADPDSTDILSLSAWGGGALRTVEGSVDSFFTDYQNFNNLDPTDANYWNLADNYFDMQWYTDYIIGASWMGNTDWPGNNIKLYRSNASNGRWRFCLIDQELALAPNSWTDCYFDHIAYMLGQDTNNPYINVWLQSLQNEQYRNYFINRFADVMNSAYKEERILGIENSFFNQTVVEMQNEYARWGNPNNIVGQMNDFYDNHLLFQYQLSERTQQVRNHIAANFELPNQVDVTLDVHPAGAGTIHISSLTPDTYPWQGVYFNGVPVKIEAIPATGYNFAHWGNNLLIADTLNAVFLNDINASLVSFDAYFEPYATAIKGVKANNSHFSLYPNPSNSYLYLKSNNNSSSNNNSNYTQVSIIDMMGRVVKQQNTLGATTVIDVKSLPASVYICQIVDTNGMVEQLRFVKTDE